MDNKEYVGVDDKFVPENENNVDTSKENERERNNKIARNIIVGIVIFCVVVSLFIIIIGFSMFKTASRMDLLNQGTQDIINIQKNLRN